MNFDVKFGMEYRGGGSVQADWAQNDQNAKDYVKNRPGGYDIVTPAKEITWDGNAEGRTVVTIGDAVYVLVSDDIISAEQLVGAELTTVRNGVEQTAEIATDEVIQLGRECVAVGECVLIMTKPGAVLQDVVFPAAGVYFIEIDTVGYARKLSIKAKTEVAKIPRKYLPDNAYVIDLYEDEGGTLRARGFDDDAYKQAVLNGAAICVTEGGALTRVLPRAIEVPSASGISTQAVFALACVIDADGWMYEIYDSYGANHSVKKKPRSQLRINASDGSEGYLVVDHDAESGGYIVRYET